MKYAKHAIRLEPSSIYDNAIVGISDNLLVYSHERILQILMRVEHMSFDEACDWADFNIYGLLSDESGFKVSYAIKHRWKSKWHLDRIAKGIETGSSKYR